jgi:hypothetical protein
VPSEADGIDHGLVDRRQRARVGVIAIGFPCDVGTAGAHFGAVAVESEEQVAAGCVTALPREGEVRRRRVGVARPPLVGVVAREADHRLARVTARAEESARHRGDHLAGRDGFGEGRVEMPARRRTGDP